MRDDDDRHAERLVDLLEQAEDRLRGVRVKGAGGLVAQEVFRPRRQGAGNGHALLLTAGELRGVGLCAVGQTDEFEQFLSARLRLVALDARDLEREADVAQHRALLEQVEALEDHADVLPRLEQIASAELRHVAPVDAHRAGGRPLEEVDAAHERALSGAAQADNAEDLPVLDAQVHIPQRVDVAGRRGVGLVEMFDFDHDSFSPENDFFGNKRKKQRPEDSLSSGLCGYGLEFGSAVIGSEHKTSRIFEHDETCTCSRACTSS